MNRFGLFLLGLCSCAATAAPQMEMGAFLNNGANFLSVSYMSAPAVLDWNNDGRKDLLVGDSDGYIWLYLNQGTDAVFYCFLWLYLSAAGGGPWSLDALRTRTRKVPVSI